MSYDELHFYAEMFQDSQDFRKAADNKIRSSTVSAQFITADFYKKAEEELSKAMRKCMRQTVVPQILTWQKANGGIGEHLLARLLGETGDPYIAIPHYWEGAGKNRVLMQEDPRPRTIGQLWSYCGHGDPERRIHKGATAEQLMACGNPGAKMIVHLLAESCVKQLRNGEPTSVYREIYDEARTTYADRKHAKDCVRCGPSGKPAKLGSDWSLAHQHAAAIRKVGKEILRDLWLAARDAHDSGGQVRRETHKAPAA
jgi:hypothetical protein